MQLDKAIQERRSIRKFKKKSPSWKKIIEAIDSTRYAPMAGNIFTLNFMLIDDKEKISKIADYSSQDFIAQSEYCVVFLSNPSRTINAYGEKTGKKFSHQQSGAAIQNFLLKLTEFELSTCWIGYFDEEKIKTLLKIPENSNIEAIFPIGYSNEKPKKRNTRDLNNFLYFNEFENKRMKEIKKPEGRYPEGY
ncbi:MAG: nitroreductase family protein [Candidatus Pacearchaeota archaeon]|jgi:nitroreductase